jgi:hypothetical protein
MFEYSPHICSVRPEKDWKDESGQHGKDIEAVVCARRKGGQSTLVWKDAECGNHSGTLSGAVLPQEAIREII